MPYKQWDIVIVPFPFVNSLKSKPRPVLILNTKEFSIQNSHYLGAMITSSNQEKWFGDIDISLSPVSGLSVDSKVRFKIFTLDERIIKKKIGTLSKENITQVKESISKILSN